MSQHASGGYETQNWDEQPYGERDGEPKFTRAHAENTFMGDLEATIRFDLLMVYRHDNFCSFTGLERGRQAW